MNHVLNSTKNESGYMLGDFFTISSGLLEVIRGAAAWFYVSFPPGT
jgi:hypothetical protein